MKIIFKITEYLPETEQIVVKFCRQNAPKPIDDYGAVAINCKFIDNSDRVNLIESLFQLGLKTIEKQENEELTLDDNLAAEMFFEKNYENFVGKVIALDTKELKKVKSKHMNKIDIE